MTQERRTQVLFIQGGGPGVHDRWDDKLADSLQRALGDDYAVLYPRMPDEADPHYRTWRTALLEAFEDLTDGAILAGHSIGGSILIHTLAEQAPRARLAGLFLVAAPYIGDGGWPSDEIAPSAGLARRLPADLPVFLYHGTADRTVPTDHLALYARALPRATARPLKGRDHQLDNDLSEVARDMLPLTG